MFYQSLEKSNCRRLHPVNCLFLLLALFSLALCFPVSRQAHASSNPRYASIVMDADTGLILYERYADKKLHPASLAKMMTLLLTFEALENGDLKLRDRVYISRHAHSMVPSKLDLPVGSYIRVEDAIYALVTKSANDIAVALAEKLAGTESEFAVQMTRKARAIGMKNTRFYNASGLHDSRQVTTARDMALLARYLIYQYPRYYDYFSTRTFSYDGHTYRNHNRLMDTYNGMDGLKTGYIQPSGFNLVASAKRQNRRIIGVVFGGRTSRSRNAHMKELLDNGFRKLDTVLMARNMPLPPRKPLSIQLAGFNSGIDTAAGSSHKWASLNTLLHSEAFRAIIGEGDYDPAASKRLETGLLAIESLKSRGKAASKPTLVETEDWAVQVGAFSSRVKTDKIVRQALGKLPKELAYGSPAIAPLRTEEGWLFRGRLTGFSKDDAIKACRYLPDCLPVSPQAY